MRGRRAPEGSRITVFMPDQRNPQPTYYGFAVGARGNPMHPDGSRSCTTAACS